MLIYWRLTMTIKKGDKVKVEYTGTYDDGAVFDSSEGREPLEFTAGEGQVIKGFDEAVIGMKFGAEKKIHIKAEDAYGNQDPRLIQKIPKEMLPKERDPEVGMAVVMQRADGMQFQAKIIGVSDKEVTIDLNHPLAGKALNFKIKLV